MQKIIFLLFKVFTKIYSIFSLAYFNLFTRALFYIKNIQHKSFSSKGIPYIMIARGGRCMIGNNFSMNNALWGNPIGRTQRCILFVDKGALLIIGSHVGISSTAIVCHYKIIIEDFVKIGAGVCIYDTDFHSLEPHIRNSEQDLFNCKKSPVYIKKGAFIGAHSTILKGVTVGENSIIGACSVVTKNIPDKQIWAGNPAKFIRNL